MNSWIHVNKEAFICWFLIVFSSNVAIMMKIHAKASPSVTYMPWNFTFGQSLKNINDECHYVWYQRQWEFNGISQYRWYSIAPSSNITSDFWHNNVIMRRRRETFWFPAILSPQNRQGIYDPPLSEGMWILWPPPSKGVWKLWSPLSEEVWNLWPPPTY